MLVRVLPHLESVEKLASLKFLRPLVSTVTRRPVIQTCSQVDLLRQTPVPLLSRRIDDPMAQPFAFQSKGDIRRHSVEGRNPLRSLVENRGYILASDPLLAAV